MTEIYFAELLRADPNHQDDLLGEPCCECGKTIINMHQFGCMARKWWPASGIVEMLCVCKDCMKKAHAEAEANGFFPEV
jgi:hypothetical protein